MRAVALASLGLVALAGCAATGGAGEWRQIQRDRIDRSHRVRSLDTALTEVLRRAPNRAPQDPQHIDQRLPPPPGPRRYRHDWQPLVATVQVGAGTVAARVPGTVLDDRADASFLRATIDTGPGAALHAEFWGSDDELFRGRFISDSTAPAPADADLCGFDVFPHVRLDHQLGDVSIPVRLGAFADWQRLDHGLSGVDRQWIGFGPRVVVEPTWRFLSGDDVSLELFTRFGGSVGAAWFREAWPGGDDSDTTVRWGGELGGGLRGRFGAVHAEVGYRVHDTLYGDIDGDLYGSRSGTTLQRQQLFVGFGLTY